MSVVTLDYLMATDSGWLDAEPVVELGLKFGPVGPLLFKILAVRHAERGCGGACLGLFEPSDLARETFSDEGTVRAVLAHMQEQGLISISTAIEVCISDAFYPLLSSPRSARERERRRVTARVRARILERDGESCGFCGTEHDLQIDHIFPVALGGKSDDDNLQVLCGPCNRAKGARHDG
jgi:hypothetical protein